MRTMEDLSQWAKSHVATSSFVESTFHICMEMLSELIDGLTPILKLK
jgi:hypothetical protein